MEPQGPGCRGSVALGDEMLLRILASIAIDQICFLELSSDEVIDPDFAMRQLESISAQLAALEPVEIETLVSLIRETAEDQVSAERREFISKIPDYLGLTEK